MNLYANMDYKKEYEKVLLKNINNVLNELETKNMTLKISNWANKYQYSFNIVKNKILEDEMFRCVFAKDPAKQNLYQTLAATYISSFKNVVNFKTLPAGGKNAIYLTNGKIFKGNSLKNQSKDIKSIDFSWNTGSYDFYASHKYTAISGGAQDNQYDDVQKFLHHCRDCSIKNTIFLAICDGDYYLQKDSKTGDDTKINRLRRLTDNRTSFVLSINELHDFLEQYT
jgi:hypothetical protein